MEDHTVSYEAPSAEDYFSDNTQGRNEIRHALESGVPPRVIRAKQRPRGAKRQDSLGSRILSAAKAELDAQLDKLNLPRPNDELDLLPVLRDGTFPYVGDLLRKYGQGEWALRPRIFCILRVLGCQELMDAFVALKATDASLPYSERNLPHAIKGYEKRSRFLRLQKLVLSNPNLGHLEKEGREHFNFPTSADGYFTQIKLLGHGGTGKVDHVYGPLTLKRFARKRIDRGVSALKDQKALRSFQNELSTLKAASHRHLVKLVSSYTDPTYVVLIMRPVADEDLNGYLERHVDLFTDRNVRKQCIQTFFGCLMRALEYLHSRGIQHKDIKPHNILVKKDDIYLTDFGTAKVHGEASRSISTGLPSAWTPKYVAPEIVAFESHGKSSDIWSMGCVFLEMATILHDHTLEELGTFYTSRGFGMRAYHQNPQATVEWLDFLGSSTSGSDTQPLAWIKDMMQAQPNNRPTASQVTSMITDTQSEHRYFCFRCLELDSTNCTVDTPAELLTGTMLKHYVQSDYAMNKEVEGAEETVTAQFLEEAEGNRSQAHSAQIEILNDIAEDVQEMEPQYQPDAKADSNMTGKRRQSDLPVLQVTSLVDNKAAANSSAHTAPSVTKLVKEGENSEESLRPVTLMDTEPCDTPNRSDKKVAFAETSSSEPTLDQQDRLRSQHADRFSGLHTDRRPLPTEPEPELLSIDDQPIVAPEPLVPPPLDVKDCYPLPQASFVPSYILAGSNRFSMKEVRDVDPALGSFNLFVYGRLMFPSTLRGFAAHSTKGVYSHVHQRRLVPSSQDWSRANMSVKHAAEAITPACLHGYDVWRPSGYELAAVQETSMTPAILENRKSERLGAVDRAPPGKVKGFLLLGVTEEALRYCDVVFGSDHKTLRRGKVEAESNNAPVAQSNIVISDALFERRRVTVEIQLTNGQIRSVPSFTYVWTRRARRLWHPWKPETFLRSPDFQNISEVQDKQYAQEEALLAQTMKINYALVGDEVCATILAGDLERMQDLLNDYTDINAPCRRYGTPLQAAVAKGSEDMVQLLLNNGANPSERGGRYGTPLIAATMGGRKAITRLLLKQRADIFASDKKHVNALYQAVGRGDYAIIEMLLNAGAWLSRDFGEIKDLAFEKGDSDVQALLVEFDISDARMASLEAAKTSDRLEDGEKGGRSIKIKTSSQVLKTVMSKILILSSASGGWRGRKGVAVTRAALAAGASPKILDYIRSAIGPVTKMVDILREADQRREGTSEQTANMENRIVELDTDDEEQSVDSKPQIKVTEAKGSSNLSRSGLPMERSLSRASSTSSRSSQSRSPSRSIKYVSSQHAEFSSSSSSSSSDESSKSSPPNLQPRAHPPEARRSSTGSYIPTPGPAGSAVTFDPRVRHNVARPPPQASARLSSYTPRYLEPPTPSRPRARSLDHPYNPPYTRAQPIPIAPARHYQPPLYRETSPPNQIHNRTPQDAPRRPGQSRCGKCNGIGWYREVWHDRDQQRRTREVQCTGCEGRGVRRV